MQRIIGSSFARHRHGGYLHVHWRIHFGILELGGVLSWVLVNLLACSVWVMRCTTLLSLAIWRPLRRRYS